MIGKKERERRIAARKAKRIQTHSNRKIKTEAQHEEPKVIDPFNKKNSRDHDRVTELERLHKRDYPLPEPPDVQGIAED